MSIRVFGGISFALWFTLMSSLAQAEGAFAWGSNKKQPSIGIVVNHASQQKANIAAIQKCTKSGASSCEIVLAFRKTCIAIARPKDNRDANWHSLNNDIAKAKEKALEMCQNRHKTSYKIVSAHCDHK